MTGSLTGYDRRGISEYRDRRLNDPTGWSTSWITDPIRDWEREGRSLAAYAKNLVDSDPYAQALITARLDLTHGALGLRFRSRYQSDPDPSVSEAERSTQRRIEDAIGRASSGLQLDAGGALTRQQIERLVDRTAIICGDGFAIRVFLPGRPGAEIATAWRVIDPMRVRNPDGIRDWSRPTGANSGGSAPSGHVIWQGIELDASRQPHALWIEVPARDPAQRKSEWMRVRYYGDDGARTVIHRVCSSVPGQIRGFSEFSGLMVAMRHLKGVSEAHVVAKRSQACDAKYIRSADPDTAKRYAAAGAVAGPNTPDVPGQEKYIGKDGDVFFPNHGYQGSDFREFAEAQIRPVSAAWGLPWQIVLSQLSSANLASSRGAMDQAVRKGSEWQLTLTAQCTSFIDQSILREHVARGTLDVSFPAAMRGYYLPPKSWSTDRLKDANAATKQIKIGRSPTQIFAELWGEDFEEQVRKHAEDIAFAEANGVDIMHLIGVQPKEETVDAD